MFNITNKEQRAANFPSIQADGESVGMGGLER